MESITRNIASLAFIVGLSGTASAYAAPAPPTPINSAIQKEAPTAPGLQAVYSASSPPGASAGANYTLTVPTSNTYLSGYRGYAGINIPQAGQGLLTGTGNLLLVGSIYYSTVSADPGYGFILQDTTTGAYHSSSGGGSIKGAKTSDPNFPNSFVYAAGFGAFAPAWPKTIRGASNSGVQRAAIIFFGAGSCHSINQNAFKAGILPGISITGSRGGYSTEGLLLKRLQAQSGSPDTHFNFTTAGN